MSCKVGDTVAKGSRGAGDVTPHSAEPGPARKGSWDRQQRVLLRHGWHKTQGSQSAGKKSEAIHAAWLWAANLEPRCRDLPVALVQSSATAGAKAKNAGQDQPGRMHSPSP